MVEVAYEVEMLPLGKLYVLCPKSTVPILAMREVVSILCEHVQMHVSVFVWETICPLTQVHCPTIGHSQGGVRIM